MIHIPFWNGCPATDYMTGFHAELGKFSLHIGPEKEIYPTFLPQ
jgi:hypothetical protein